MSQKHLQGRGGAEAGSGMEGDGDAVSAPGVLLTLPFIPAPHGSPRELAFETITFN